MYEVKESDWKLFRKMLPGWQEAYMENLIKEYIEILQKDTNASVRFWELEERIFKDRKHTGVSAEMSRSKMFDNIIILIHEKAISIEDLSEFSENLKNSVNRLFYIINNISEQE